MELFRAYTVRENYQNRDSVMVDWFCELRTSPVAELEALVQNLSSMSAEEQSKARRLLDQLLTATEVEELARYIRTTSGFEVKRTRIPVPIADGRKAPDFSGRDAKMEGEYFHIHESPGYTLSIPITGFVDLSDPPNTRSAV